MQTLQVKKYNALEMVKYSKVCDDYSNKGDYSQPFPQQAFWGFYTNQGNFRETGYVAFDNRRAVLAKTKKLAVIKFNRE